MTGFAECMWSQQLKTGYPHEDFVEGLAMGMSVTAPSAHRCAYYQRQPHLLVIHPTEFCHVVYKLVGCQGKKITKHDLYNWTKTTQGQSSANSDYACFGNGSSEHTR